MILRSSDRPHLNDIGFHQSNLCFHFAFFMRTKIGIENPKTISKNTATTTTRLFIASIPFLSWTGSFYCFCLYFKKKWKAIKVRWSRHWSKKAYGRRSMAKRRQIVNPFVTPPLYPMCHLEKCPPCYLHTNTNVLRCVAKKASASCIHIHSNK